MNGRFATVVAVSAVVDGVIGFADAPNLNENGPDVSEALLVVTETTSF